MKWRPANGLAAVLAACITLSLVSCASEVPAPIAIRDFIPDGLALPAVYDRWNETTSSFDKVPLEWSRVATGAPDTNNCPPEGEGALWMWANRPYKNIGDPDVHLNICDVGSPNAAADIFRRIPLERTVLPQDDFYKAWPTSTQDLNLAADEAKVACVWGNAGGAQCRGWAYLARYGRYLVTSNFVIRGNRGALDGRTFVVFASSIDRFMAHALGSATPVTLYALLAL